MTVPLELENIGPEVTQGHSAKEIVRQRQLAKMLFTLKEILTDCDDEIVKAEIMDYLKSASTMESPVAPSEYVGYIRKIVSTIKPSFDSRYNQAKSDSKVIENINSRIDSFRNLHNSRVSKLLSEVTEIVENEIDTAKREIIKKLDPYGIKERFPRKSDFEVWMQEFNDNYKAILTNAVNRKVNNMMRNFVGESEVVANNINSMISDRQIHLERHDRFYASIADTKLAVTNNTKAAVTQMSSFNMSLTQASDELFLKIWHERQKFDLARNATTAIAGVAAGVGAGVAANAALAAVAASTTSMIATGAGFLGTAGAVALGASATSAAAVGTSASAFATAVAAANIGFPPIIPITIAIITAASIALLAYKISTSVFGVGMEKKVRECQKEFIAEVDRSAQQIKQQVTESLLALFEQEFKTLEQNFFQFRTSTHIDYQKTLQLQEKFTILQKELDCYEQC